MAIQKRTRKSDLRVLWLSYNQDRVNDAPEVTILRQSAQDLQHSSFIHVIASLFVGYIRPPGGSFFG